MLKLFFSKGGGGVTAYVRSLDGQWCYYYAHLQEYAPGLAEGISVASLAIGLFGMSEIVQSFGLNQQGTRAIAKISRLWPTAEQFRRAFPAMLRGTAVGSYVNTVPIGGLTADYGFANTVAASATFDVLALALAPGVAKSFSVSPIPQNGTSVLSIVVNNPNTLTTLTCNMLLNRQLCRNAVNHNPVMLNSSATLSRLPGNLGWGRP